MISTTMAKDVSSHHPDFDRMLIAWEPIKALESGTEGMRAAGERWLPKEHKEPQEAYDRRLKGATLLSAFEDAVDRVVSKPFSRPVSVENLPDAMADIERDASRGGDSLTSVASKWLETSAAYGLAHMLIDYPDTREMERGGDGTPSVAAVKANNVRPFLRMIHPADLFFWRPKETKSGGEPSLEEVRFLETITVGDGEYALKEEKQIRRITTKVFQVWRKTQDDSGNSSWKLFDEFENTLGVVPIVTHYTNKTGFMVADPPFESLAAQNIRHWTLDADHRHTLRVAGFAFLYQRGVSEEDLEDDLVVGPFRVVRTTKTPEETDLSFIEHNGRGIEAIERGLKATEDRMEVLGMRPFLETSRSQTATARGADMQEDETQAQQWVRDMETAIRNALAFCAQWMRAELAADVEAKIFNEFGIGNRSPQELALLEKLNERGVIRDATMLNETRRRGVLSPDVDAEDEVERAREDLKLRPTYVAPLKPEDEDDEADPEQARELAEADV